MKIKRLSQLLFIIVLTILFSFLTNAQEKGRIGLLVKAQIIPQVGISYGISNKIQTRFSTFVSFRKGDLISSTVSSLDLLIRLSSDKSLSTYIGPDMTYYGYIENLFFGILLGAQYNLHPKVGLFAEFGPSLGIGDEMRGISFLNTGIGIVYYFN
jgi:hypothetical protein